MKTRAIVASGLVACASFSAGCQTNPETGGRSLITLSKADEIKIGEQAAPQFTEEFGGKVKSEQCQRYTTEIGMKLKDQIERKDYHDLPWEFTLLDSGIVNAFALPGGKVFCTRGLAGQLTSEAQLAGVLGHEIGHVAAQHGNQRISQASGINMGLQVIGVLAGAGGEGGTAAKYAELGIPALQMGSQLVLLKYSRTQEIEADSLGMKYMSRANYNPRAQREVMELLGRLSSGNNPPAILATHPSSAERIKKIDEALATEYASTQNNPAYQMYPERYQKNMLEPLSKLPPPPPPKPVKQASLDNSLDSVLGPPALWCSHCRAEAQLAAELAAQEVGPVAPREGIYSFFAPAARP
jgi:predicted Zn-dependent protease